VLIRSVTLEFELAVEVCFGEIRMQSVKEHYCHHNVANTKRTARFVDGRVPFL
jgi:hypothetical protein